MTEAVASAVAALSLFFGGGAATPASAPAASAAPPPEIVSPRVGRRFGRLVIPKLGVRLPIVEGTKPAQLALGVGHLYRSGWPGEAHETSIFFAHRTTDVLGYDGPFRRIGELEPGDRIIARMPYGRVVYEVLRLRRMSEAAWRRYRPRSGRQRALYAACDPIGERTHRLIVVAERIPDA